LLIETEETFTYMNTFPDSYFDVAREDNTIGGDPNDPDFILNGMEEES
jgi:hypothetical protein